MASIKINGRTISVGSGGNIVITDNDVYINGKRVDDSEFDSKQRTFNIVVEGDVAQVSNEAGEITVNGNAGVVKNISGDVRVTGNVEGSISTVSGDAKIGGTVNGSISTVSGDVSHR